MPNNLLTLFRSNFPALTHRNFRLYWIGQCFSLIGTWMQSIAQTWLVYSLTGSPFLLGLLGAMQFLPITIFSLFAGVIIDKYPKRNILIITQTSSMLLAFTLSLLVFTHTVQYVYVLILATILGLTNTIDMPTRQSFTIEMAGKKDLMNAIALNSAIFNLARILGPAIGALILASFGAGWCFLFNGVSFMAVLTSLLKIEVDPYVREKVNDNNILQEIKDGLIYIVKEPSLLQTILMVLVIGIFIFNYNVLIPVFTKNVLQQSEKVFGLLMSALGLGSLAGALMVSVRSKSGPKLRILTISGMMVSILLVVISFTKTYYLSSLLLIITGIFNILFSTTANSTLQITSKEEYRGRVMSVYALVFAGATPLGNMFAGYTADKMGASDAFLISGILSLLLIGLLVFMFKTKEHTNGQDSI
jgi:predicted MFS family arabinose efflux permease